MTCQLVMKVTRRLSALLLTTLRAWLLTAFACVFLVSTLTAGDAANKQSGSWTVESAQTGRGWIEQMSRAMQSLTYTGTFVYLHDGEVESMRISHSKIDGIEHERLSSLNGEAREIVRNAESVVCIWPGTKSVIVNKAQPRTPFPQFDPATLGELESFYQFRKMGMERVAGRDVEVIDITPLDGYRYGYRLWVDSENFMLLRSAMSDRQGQMVEQVMFTDINYPDSIPGEVFETPDQENQFKWFANAVDAPVVPMAQSGFPGVVELNLPEGFTLESDKITPVAGVEMTARRIMYTDGLASLSIFITDLSKEASGGVLKGASAMGAVHAYGVMRENWHATVVGEVPHATVRMLAESMVLSQR